MVRRETGRGEARVRGCTLTPRASPALSVSGEAARLTGSPTSGRAAESDHVDANLSAWIDTMQAAWRRIDERETARRTEAERHGGRGA